MRSRSLNPGDVVVGFLNAKKVRPWLVLWVDDDLELCCLVAMSKTALNGLGGVAFPKPHPVYRQLTGWVMVWPTNAVTPPLPDNQGVVPPEDMPAVRAAVSKMIDLEE